jgi:hypothetical protein
MKTKIGRFIIATFIGTLGYYAIGWFVFDFILGDYTNLHTSQLLGFKKSSDQISLVLLVLSCGAYAALISFIFVFLAEIKSPTKSFAIGAIIGILVAIMTDTYWYATSNFYSNVTVVMLDILAAGVTVGFMALLIAFVNKKLD